jgi:hypothetical protein
MRLYLEKTKRADGMAQGVDPEFKPQYCKQQKIEKIPKNN